MEIQNIIIILVIGFVSGMLSGILGIGGAIVIIPALVFILGCSQQTAQGTTLLMMVLPVGSLAAYQYYRQGFVDLKVAFILAGAFFIGGYFGAKVATQVPEQLLKKVFAITLVILAVRIWVSSKV